MSRLPGDLVTKRRRTIGAVATAFAFASVVVIASGPSPSYRAVATAPVNGPLMAQTNRARQAEAGEAATTTSYNWSGYVQLGTVDKTFTEVTDTFVVPTVVDGAPAGTQYATDWVGIGGFDFNNHSPNLLNLIQAGIETVVTNNGGQQTSFEEAWTETLPHPERALKLRVSAGDSIAVTVEEIAKNKWRMTVDDVTTGKSRNRSVRYKSTGLSAEAILERPCPNLAGGSCVDPENLPELAQTSDVTFDPGYFSEAPSGVTPVNVPLLGTVPNAALVGVTMIDDDSDSTPLATASAPDDLNEGFAVADGATAPPPPSPTQSQK